MFKPMRSHLKNKLTDSTELTKIQVKLHTFFEKNPDVDHYLDDYCRKKWWMGVLMGIILTIIFIEVVIIAVMIIDPGAVENWLSQFAANNTEQTKQVIDYNIHFPLVR